MMPGVFAFVLVLAIAMPADAQEPYPNRPITMVVPFPPGGVADLTARPVAAAMEKMLKNPVGVVNKQGAASDPRHRPAETARPS